jgi:hypothetical protein
MATCLMDHLDQNSMVKAVRYKDYERGNYNSLKTALRMTILPNGRADYQSLYDNARKTDKENYSSYASRLVGYYKRFMEDATLSTTLIEKVVKTRWIKDLPKETFDFIGLSNDLALMDLAWKLDICLDQGGKRSATTAVSLAGVAVGGDVDNVDHEGNNFFNLCLYSEFRGKKNWSYDPNRYKSWIRDPPALYKDQIKATNITNNERWCDRCQSRSHVKAKCPVDMVDTDLEEARKVNKQLNLKVYENIEKLDKMEKDIASVKKSAADKAKNEKHNNRGNRGGRHQGNRGGYRGNQGGNRQSHQGYDVNFGYYGPPSAVYMAQGYDTGPHQSPSGDNPPNNYPAIAPAPQPGNGPAPGQNAE